MARPASKHKTAVLTAKTGISVSQCVFDTRWTNNRGYLVTYTRHTQMQLKSKQSRKA